jgi:hypothetical protein
MDTKEIRVIEYYDGAFDSELYDDCVTDYMIEEGIEELTHEDEYSVMDSFEDWLGFNQNSDSLRLEGNEYIFAEVETDETKYVVIYDFDYRSDKRIIAMMKCFFDSERRDAFFEDRNGNFDDYGDIDTVVAYKPRSERGTSYYFCIYEFIGKMENL